MNHDELLEVIAGALCPRDEVLALWLSGSISRGTADAYSDLDLELVVEDGALRSTLADLPPHLASACDAVLVKTYGSLVHLVTRDWLRADVLVRERADVEQNGVAGPVEVRYDPSSLHLAPVADRGPGGRAGRSPVGVVEEFMRFLGLLPVAAARGEWIGAFAATGIMVTQLLELMQTENRSARVGGALRVNERLTEEQRLVFSTLPPLRPDADAVVAVQCALARDFLPRARRVAQASSADYPDALEEALLAHLRRHAIQLVD